MALDQGPDVLLQLAGGGMDAAPQLLAGKFCKLAFDLVDPRGRSWCEMDVIVRPATEPWPDESGFVGRVIVHDDVDVEVGQHLRVDLLEEGEQLRGAMPLVAFADDKTRGDIQRCEKGGGAYNEGYAAQQQPHGLGLTTRRAVLSVAIPKAVECVCRRITALEQGRGAPTYEAEAR